jgi:site-specific recombinase XerD
MLARTKDLEAVRKYLGHRDPRSTEHYARVVDAALIDIAQRRPRR